MIVRRALFATALLVVSGTAAAHTGTGSGLGGGLLHPILGWDHLLAAFAVGLWAARERSRAVILLPVAFLAAMSVGIVLGIGGIALPGVEPALLLSLVVVGAALAFTRRAPLGVAAALLATFGTFHGFAHGAESAAASLLTTYGLGLLTATAALHGLGLLAGRCTSSLAMRMTGAAIGSAGLWALVAG